MESHVLLCTTTQPDGPTPTTLATSVTKAAGCPPGADESEQTCKSSFISKQTGKDPSTEAVSFTSSKNVLSGDGTPSPSSDGLKDCSRCCTTSSTTADVVSFLKEPYTFKPPTIFTLDTFQGPRPDRASLGIPSSQSPGSGDQPSETASSPSQPPTSADRPTLAADSPTVAMMPTSTALGVDYSPSISTNPVMLTVTMPSGINSAVDDPATESASPETTGSAINSPHTQPAITPESQSPASNAWTTTDQFTSVTAPAASPAGDVGAGPSTNSTASTASPDHSSSSKGSTIGGVIGALIITALLAAGAMYCMKHHRRRLRPLPFWRRRESWSPVARLRRSRHGSTNSASSSISDVEIQQATAVHYHRPSPRQVEMSQSLGSGGRVMSSLMGNFEGLTGTQAQAEELRRHDGR